MQEAFRSFTIEVGRLGAWLARIPFWAFAALVLAIAAAKSTFIWRLPNVHGAAPAFPEARENSDLFLGIVSYHVVGGSNWGYLILNGAALFLACLLIWLSASREERFSATGRILLILAFSWPFVATHLAWFGHGTEFFPLGVALTILAKRRWIWIAGVLVTALAHPAQSFATFTTLALLTLAPEFRSWRVRALTGMAVGGLALVGFTLWLRAAGLPSRISLAIEAMPLSLLDPLRHGILGPYSGWGVWWIVILVAFAITAGRTRLLILVTAFIIPSLGAMLNWDGTRDFVGPAAAVGLVLFLFVFNPSSPVKNDTSGDGLKKPSPEMILAVIALLFLFLPNIQIMMIGDGIPEPGWMWVGLFENYVLPAFR